MDPRLDGESDPARLARVDTHLLTAHRDDKAYRCWLTCTCGVHLPVAWNKSSYAMEEVIRRVASEHRKAAIAAQLDKAATALGAWKSGRPTAPGYYWLKPAPQQLGRYFVGDTTPHVLLVQVSAYANGLTVWFPGSDMDDPLTEDAFDGAEWLGPLEIPE